jgi:hypothetical protein
MEEELINVLKELAGKLFDRADQLDALADQIDPEQWVELADYADGLRAACAELTKVHEALSQDEGAVVEWLAAKAAEYSVSVSSPDQKVQQFLQEHLDAIGAVLKERRVPQRMEAWLSDRIAGLAGSFAEKSGPIDRKDVMETVGNLRDGVCAGAVLAGRVRGEDVQNLLRGTAQGLIGVGTVVIDITTAASAAISGTDFTGWVLFKAVKSVQFGVSLVKGAAEKVQSAVARIRRSILAGKAPKPPF